MQASDIMSPSVISVGPDTPVVRVASILRERKIGGLPVLAGNALVGIVTEKDLLHRREIGTDRGDEPQAWWRRVVGRSSAPEWYVKSHGRRARHVMTRRVIVVAPTTSLRVVTSLFDAHRIGRAPVMSRGRMVGIVTCADLVRALAIRSARCAAPRARVDYAAILEALQAELRQQPWWNGSVSTFDVEEGVVVFHGFVENDTERGASRVAAENVEGVREVIDDRRPTSELPSML